MPEIVQPNRWQAGPSDELLEVPRDVLGHEPGAVLTGEDQPGVDPRLPVGQPLLDLLSAVPAQDVDGLGVEGDGAGTAVALGHAGVDGGSVLHDLLAHGQQLMVDVDVSPGQSDGFPPP